MRFALILTSALVLALGASAADAQKIDANGRCHDKSGKFAKAAVCAGLSPSASTAKAPPVTAGPAMKGPAMSGPAMKGPAPAATPAHTYKLDTKGKCRDEKGKIAKKGLCTP